VTISLSSDGWVTLPGPEGAGLHVRPRESEGRMVITGLYLHAPEVTPEIFRAVSISRLEAQLNAGPRVEPGQPVAGLTWPVIADFTRSVRDDSEPSLAELRDRARQQTREARPKEPDRPRLTRPDGASPEEFYPRVAAAYSQYVSRTRAPAKEMAAEAGVPITTAHRWIREARRRGFLTPARKGKAG
jgi:hypothetical protein